MVKVHDHFANVESGHGAHQVEQKHWHHGVQYQLGVVQKLQSTVSKKGDVTIIQHRDHEQSVPKQASHKQIVTYKH